MEIDNNLKPSIGKGGIESITLFDVEEIVSVEYDRTNDTFYNLRLNENAKQITISWSRDAAEYKEQRENREGMLWVEHMLIFTIDGLNSKIDSEIMALEKSNEKGVAVVVNTRHGERLLVGYSKKLREESALRFRSAEVSSALMRQRSPCVTWKLSSVDGEKAKSLV